MKKICPRCGASSDEKKFIGLFCEDCYSERLDVGIERKISYEVCKICGKMRSGKEWVPFTPKILEKQLIHALTGTYDNVRFVIPDSGEGTGQVVFLIRAGDEFVEVVKQFELVKRPTICEMDSRASGGYFEAIIQVRCLDPEKTERLAKKLAQELERKTFIAKAVASAYGIDLYVGSNKAVMELLERLGIKATKTAKLHGVKDGQRIYRNTYCVRD